MTTRSMFTEAIEDHLALKRQNASLDEQMPLSRFATGDPLDRFPGGRGHAPDSTIAGAAPMVATAADTQLMEGPTPEQAMRAAMSVEPGIDRPFEPLSGMTPMLSLVEDLDDEEDGARAAGTSELPASAAASILRFPGGVGPRGEGDAAGSASALAERERITTGAASSSEDAPTGEQPVIMIDADEPFGAPATREPREPRAPRQAGGKRPRFFGLGRKRKNDNAEGDSWFGEGARDFNWD